MDLEWLKSRIRKSEYLISIHAEKERLNDDVDTVEIEQAILSGHILENYPTDPRGPSCLILGFSKDRAIHVVCGQTQNVVVIITVYLPKPPRWARPDKRGK